MGLNIKNERVCALAKQAAQLTGKNQTSVIEEALEKLIADHEAAEAERERERRNRFDMALTALQKRWDEAPGPHLTDADLYDSVTGLPE